MPRLRVAPDAPPGEAEAEAEQHEQQEHEQEHEHEQPGLAVAWPRTLRSRTLRRLSLVSQAATRLGSETRAWSEARWEGVEARGAMRAAGRMVDAGGAAREAAERAVEGLGGPLGSRTAQEMAMDLGDALRHPWAVALVCAAIAVSLKSVAWWISLHEPLKHAPFAVQWAASGGVALPEYLPLMKAMNSGVSLALLTACIDVGDVGLRTLQQYILGKSFSLIDALTPLFLAIIVTWLGVMHHRARQMKDYGNLSPAGADAQRLKDVMELIDEGTPTDLPALLAALRLDLIALRVWLEGTEGDGDGSEEGGAEGQSHFDDAADAVVNNGEGDVEEAINKPTVGSEDDDAPLVRTLNETLAVLDTFQLCVLQFRDVAPQVLDQLGEAVRQAAPVRSWTQLFVVVGLGVGVLVVLLFVELAGNEWAIPVALVFVAVLAKVNAWFVGTTKLMKGKPLVVLWLVGWSLAFFTEYPNLIGAMQLADDRNMNLGQMLALMQALDAVFRLIKIKWAGEEHITWYDILATFGLAACVAIQASVNAAEGRSMWR